MVSSQGLTWGTYFNSQPLVEMSWKCPGNVNPTEAQYDAKKK